VWVLGRVLWWYRQRKKSASATGVKEPSSVNTDQTVNTDQKKAAGYRRHRKAGFWRMKLSRCSLREEEPEAPPPEETPPTEARMTKMNFNLEDFEYF